MAAIMPPIKGAPSLNALQPIGVTFATAAARPIGLPNHLMTIHVGA